MVHTVFTWPYGGREVSLSFACNGWTDRTRMTMVEGSSKIFQVICDIPPGYYMYKFVVDGVWRVDEQKFCIQDEYGMINNVILVNEPELISSISPGQPSTPTMSIDRNVNLLDQTNQPSCSGAPYHESELQLLDSDIDISRRRLCIHLGCHKIYELIPDSGKVIALDVGVAVKEAFHVMCKEGLSVVPIWDGNCQQISGMLTASDFILMLRELNRNRAVLPDEQLEAHTVSAWKEGKAQLYEQGIGAAQLTFGRPLIRAGPDESLKDLALRILQNQISTVPILYSTKEGSCPQLLHVACLGGILKHVCEHFRNYLDYLPLLRRQVGSLPLGTWTGGEGASNPLVALRPSETLSSALTLLIEAQISSIPIIDDQGSLVNVYSRSDITSLAKDGAYAHIQLDRTIMSQALEHLDGHRYQTCTRSDPLYVVMERLSGPAVRRLVVVQAGSQRVEGIITISDVFKFILS